MREARVFAIAIVTKSDERPSEAPFPPQGPREHERPILVAARDASV
jgi:hypothetical protein